MLVTVRTVTQASDAQPAHDRQRPGRRRHRAHGRRVLQPAVAREAAARRAADRAVRQGRHVPRRLADDEPDRRPDRRSHRSDRADLPAEREGPAQHVGARRLGRGGVAALPRPRHRRSGARRRSAAGSASSTAATALATIHLPETMRDKEHGPPAAGVRRAAAGAARAGDAQARARAHVAWACRTSSTASWCAASTAPCRIPLTGAQRRAIAEIEGDLAGPNPMHRLLQGDVGSGKTVVAVSTLLHAVQGGHQGALMAPTEVLAEQHADRRAALLGDLTRARPRQPVRRPAAARRAAHQSGHRIRAQARCWPGWPTDRSTSRSARTR